MIEQIIQAIDDAYRSAPDGRRGRSALSGSQLGRCPRALAQLLGGAQPKPTAPEARRVMERGTQRGESLERALVAAGLGRGWTVQTQAQLWIPLPLPPGYAERAVIAYPDALRADPDGSTLLVPGAADAVVDAPDGRRTLLDFKAVGSYAYGQTYPSESYVAQVLAYAAGLANDGHAPDACYLVLEAQDSDVRKGMVGGALRAQAVDPTAERERAIFRRSIEGAQEAVIAWLDGHANLVAEPYSLDGRALPWECNYCPLGPERGGCWAAHGTLRNGGTETRPKWFVVD